VSQQVLTTDATGKFSVPTTGSVVTIQAAGLFPANTEPANAPPAAPARLTLLAPVDVQGIAVGGSRLVQTLDYGDTFTLGAGPRSGLQPNQSPTGAALNVEYHAPTAPERAWSPLWQISDDLHAIGVPGLVYPGPSGGGSDGGIVQGDGTAYTGIE